MGDPAQPGRRQGFWRLRGAAALIGLISVLSVVAAWAETLSGQVISVADGDTVTVRDAAQQVHKIRLAGIDAPESRQPYGQRARQSLSEMVAGQWVEVDYDKADRYGRLVGKVQVDGVDVNLEQLRRGLAWHYKRYEEEQSPEDRQVYAQAERRAQAEYLGLWRDRQPQAPWDYRKLQRTTQEP
jgi:endonuclease YncB( thermonuclease family)